MLKRIILLTALMALLAPEVFANPWIKSLATAQKAAKEKNQLIFVDMFAQWCGWCHRMEQEVFPAMAFQQATDDMVLLRLNTEDGGEGTKMSQKFQVTSLPTFLILKHDLSLAGVIRGYAPANDFSKMVRDTRTKYEEFEKRLKSESTFSKDYEKRLALAKELTARSAYAEAEVRLKKLVADKAPADIRDQAYYELAVAQFFLQKYADTLKTVQKFGTLQSKGEPYERARLLIADVYMAQGNYAGAATEFRNFKAKFPTSPLVRNVDMVLPDLERRVAAARK